MSKEEALIFLRDEGYNAALVNGVLMVYVKSSTDIVVTNKELGAILRIEGYSGSFGVLNSIEAEQEESEETNNDDSEESIVDSNVDGTDSGSDSSLEESSGVESNSTSTAILDNTESGEVSTSSEEDIDSTDDTSSTNETTSETATEFTETDSGQLTFFQK